MKQSVLIILAILFSISTTTSVLAGGGGGHNNYNRGHNNYNRGYNNYNRGYNNYGGRGGRGRGSYAGAALIGGIAGGIIGASISQPYYGNAVYVAPYPVRAVPIQAIPIQAVPTVPIVGNNFLLQPNGDCFLITNGTNGNQVLSSVPYRNCQ